MLFNFAILSCFFLFFLIIDLCLLILAVIAQIFNPIAELKIPKVILTRKGKAKTETHQVIAETKIRKCSIKFRVVETFLCFLLILVYFFK